MEAFLHGTRLSIPWHRDVYWFDTGTNDVGLNGKIPRGSTLVRLPDYEACRFIDDLDVLASQFPKKDEANPEYTTKRQTVIDFAGRVLGPYVETVI